jgi:hypothetical protein
MTDQPNLTTYRRIGFHYYPDCLHFRESDLVSWLPELQALDTSWMVLKAPRDRAIPEYFIQGLRQADIQPIVHFAVPVSDAPTLNDLHILADSYAHWGIEHVIMFDCPNNHLGWSEATWAQEDLVERFLDRFIPLAQVLLQSGIKPVFPPLQRGGSYWDTAFLRNSLVSLCRRKQEQLANDLLLACYGSANEHLLNWGAGGPERWPGARPYHTAPGEEDQRSFRAYEWYQAISRSVLQKDLPVILLGLGTIPEPFTAKIDAIPHAQVNLSMVQLMSGVVPQASENDLPINSVDDTILCGNFWLLTTAAGSPYQGQAWYSPSTKELPVVAVVKNWLASHSPSIHARKSGLPSIKHYLLLPTYDWGVADWHLDIIRPYIKKHQPTIGFSINEAYQAQYVTVLNQGEYFSNEQLNALRSAGCQVEQIEGDGTSIASQLAER